jgi:hypothetical protein
MAGAVNGKALLVAAAVLVTDSEVMMGGDVNGKALVTATVEDGNGDVAFETTIASLRRQSTALDKRTPRIEVQTNAHHLKSALEIHILI